MRRTRKDPSLSDGSPRAIFEDAPWPSWPFIETPGRKRNIDLNKGCPPELIELAREFNQIIYISRFEVRPYTLRAFAQACRYFLAFLSTLDSVKWPLSASKISAGILKKFQTFLSSREAIKIFPRGLNIKSAHSETMVFRSVLRHGWRAGYFSGANPVDLGRSSLAGATVPASTEKMYTESEFRRIKMALAEKRKQTRGSSLMEERSYLAASCCIIFIYTPANVAGVCSLRKSALQKGEADQKFDVLTILKFRPTPKAHRTPVEKDQFPDNFGKSIDIFQGKSEIRRVFSENIEYNATRKLSRSIKDYLFVCRYTGRRRSDGGVFDVFNEDTFHIGLRYIEDEFGLLDDEKNPLKISPRKLRATYENSLPKTEILKDKADAMGHADLETTASHYEVITDNDHRRFQIGLDAIGAAIAGESAQAIATRSGAVLSVELVERLRSGILKTTVASCTDPLQGKYAPKDGRKCNKSLTCFFCFNMAVVTSDLFRLASLERRITIDAESGLLQYESKATLLTIRSIIAEEIFPCFELRHVKSARKQAQKKLHPLWVRPFYDIELETK
jgi:hypothetical protein